MSAAAMDALAGAAGSCISLTATYPLLQVSTWQALAARQQVQPRLAVAAGSNAATGKPEVAAGAASTSTQQQEQASQPAQLRAPPEVEREMLATYAKLGFPSPLKELMTYSRTRGPGALYAGLKPSLVGTAISQFLYFGLYSQIRQAVVAWRAKQHAAAGVVLRLRQYQDIGVLGSLVVASLAGAGNVLVTNPIWVVVMQMQAQQQSSDPGTRSRTAWQVVQHLYSTQGPKAFWKGLLPSLVMVVNPTVQFITYEWLVSRLLAWRAQRMAARAGRKRVVVLGVGDAFLLAALAKLAATLITYPMLVVKSRMQAVGAPFASVEGQAYQGVASSVLHVLEHEGWRGFFKGIKAKMLQTVLGAALLMAVKERLALLLRLLLLGRAVA